MDMEIQLLAERIASLEALLASGTKKFSQFTDGVIPKTTDTFVGLRGGVNYKFTDLSVMQDSNGLNTVNYQTRRLFDTAGNLSLNFSARIAYGTNGNPAIDYNAKYLYDLSGVISHAWNLRILQDSAANQAINYNTRTLSDSIGTQAASWALRKLIDGSGSDSVLWGSHQLLDSSSTISADWQNKILNDNAGHPSLSWTARVAADSAQNNSMNWNQRFLLKGAVVVVNWNGLILNDSSAFKSMDWGQRQLFANDATTLNIDYSSPTGAYINGVQVTGTPSTGQVPVATSSTTATWQTLPTGVATEEVFVSLQGSDSTGTGTPTNPWATIAHAQANISPTTTSRYAIWLTPGFYSENVSLHANVFICATAPVETRLIGNIDINHASWNTPGVDNRSGLVNIEHRTGTAIFDFTAQAGNDNGKLYFLGTRFSDQPTITGLSTFGSNQVIFKNNYFFSGVKNTGCTTQIVNSYNAGGVYENHSSAAASTASDMQILGGCNDGAYSNTWTSNSGISMEIEGVGFGAGTTVSVSGASATTTANRTSLPDVTSITVSSSGVLSVTGGIDLGMNRDYVARNAPAFSTSYTPSTTNDVMVCAIFGYTNAAAQTSAVSASVNSNVLLKVNKTDIVSANQESFSFIVPAGKTYQLINSGSGSQTLQSVYELLL